jgi:flagella basal body P-ring formation protein FlgA
VTFNVVKAETNFIPHDISVLLPVLVTNSPIKKGQILEANQFEISRRVLSLGQLNYLVPVEFALSDFQSTTSLPPFHILKVTDLKKRDLVTIGQTLKAKWIGSLFEIESVVVAKKSGGKNDIITVQNVDTKKILSARVLSPGEVEIVE